MTEQMENSMSVPYTKNYLSPTDVCGKCLYIKSRCKCRKRETTMTENEAKEYLLNRYLVVGSPVNPPKEECEKHNAVIDMAIQALEKQSMINEILNEMWQLNEIAKGYCEVGTLEEFKQYRAIGTVEELKALKANSFFNFDSPIVNVDMKSYNKAIEELLTEICKKYTEEEQKGNYQHCCVNIKNDIAEIAESMKGEKG